MSPKCYNLVIKEIAMDKNIGLKYGNLTIIEFCGKQKNRKNVYLCRCDCGREKKVRIDHLRSGAISSCGRCDKKSKSILYNVWNGMIDRCYKKETISYKNYGARGINICDDWKNDFFIFEKWALENGYKKGLSIERIDVNGNYCPKNCKFIPRFQQNRNKRNNRHFIVDGKDMILIEICEKYNINWSTMCNRLKRGWDIEKCINTPIDIKSRNKQHEEE